MLLQKNNDKVYPISLTPSWQNLSYDDLENEIWKEIPGYDDYFLVSSYGRAKSVDRIIYTSNGKQRFFKGIILKQTVNKTYNKTVGDFNVDSKIGFSYHGKSHNFRMATIVYRLFIGDIPKNMIVAHIDGNNLNNTPNNLKLITYQQKQKKIYDKNRCAKIFKFQTKEGTKKQAAARQKPVTQFTLHGNPIRLYQSIKEAALQTGIDNSSIVAAIKHKTMVSAGGFLWQYGYITENIDTLFYINFQKKSKQTKPIPLIQLDINRNLVCTFQSIKQASDTVHIHQAKIAAAIKTNTPIGGYYWKKI